MLRSKPLPAVSLLAALTLAATLHAGSGRAAPVEGNLLTGRISDWPAGKTGEVRLVPRVKMFGADGAAPLATAPVDAQGNFSLKLPDAAALARALPPAAQTWSAVTACTEAGQRAWCAKPLALKPAAQVNLFDLQAFADGQQLRNVKLGSAPFADPASGLVNTYLAFAATPTTVSGDYTFLGSRAEWNAELPAGWSWLTETYGALDAGTGVWPVKVTAGPLPAAPVYYLTALTGQAQFTSRRMQTGSRVGHEVLSVTAGGAAEKAGLKVDDLIVAIDGRDVRGNSSSLLMMAFARPPGTVLQLTVKRGDDTLTLPLTISALDSDFEH